MGMESQMEAQQLFLLPDDVLAEIISQLDCQTSVTSFSFVCKRWNLICSSPKALRSLFQLRWDPNHIHLDYSSINVFGKQHDDNRTWIDRHRSLRRRLTKIKTNQNVHQIWREPIDTARELRFWFLQPETDKLQLSWTNTTEKKLILASLDRDSGCKLSEHSRYDMLVGTMSRFSRYRCWNTLTDRYFLDSATLQVSRLTDSYLQSHCSICYKSVAYWSSPFGVFEKTRFRQKGTQIIRSGGDLSWTSQIDCTDCILVLATDQLLLIAEFHKQSSKVMITSMDACTGSVINSVTIEGCLTPYDYLRADCHFVSPQQVAIVLPTMIALVAISAEGHLSLQDSFYHHGDVLITSTFGYSLLVVETHPPQYFFGRVESNILILQILSNKILLVRSWMHAPSCECLAIDSNLDIYLAETNPTQVRSLTKYALCSNEDE